MKEVLAIVKILTKVTWDPDGKKSIPRWAEVKQGGQVGESIIDYGCTEGKWRAGYSNGKADGYWTT